MNIKHHSRRTSVLAVGLAASLSLVAVACGDDGSDGAPATTAAPATTVATTVAESGTIVDVASANPDFSILVEAVVAAGLAETLSGPGPFTVFAPTNEAFAAALTALGITKEQLFADPAALAKILTYHVVAGAVPAADVAGLNGKDVATVNGATVKVTVVGDKVMVNAANVTAVDIEASNGVIHVIDAVLLPPAA